MTGYANRREFLRRVGGGLGTLALADLLAQNGLLAGEAAGPKSPLAPRAGHFPARAKSVIWLFMEGGPSGFDLFDPKPELDQASGPAGRGHRNPFRQSRPAAGLAVYVSSSMGSAAPGSAKAIRRWPPHVDDIAFIKSVYAESPNHAPAMYQMNTGLTRPGFPERRRLGHLWPGKRKPGPARLRRAAADVGKGGAEQLGLGLSARLVPGHAAANQRPADPES